MLKISKHETVYFLVLFCIAHLPFMHVKMMTAYNDLVQFHMQPEVRAVIIWAPESLSAILPVKHVSFLQSSEMF